MGATERGCIQRGKSGLQGGGERSGTKNLAGSEVPRKESHEEHTSKGDAWRRWQGLRWSEATGRCLWNGPPPAAPLGIVDFLTSPGAQKQRGPAFAEMAQETGALLGTGPATQPSLRRLRAMF